MDFDNDGLKDLFISNGIPKRMNDIDYINFVSNGEIQQKIRENDMSQADMSLIDKFPEIKLPNKFYHNNGQLSFSDESDQVSGNLPSFSNGSVYADLDNDGDLDIVVNNMDSPAVLYENRSSDSSRNSSLQLQLKGAATNINALGARVVVYTGTEVRTYEKYATRGFMSSMEIPLSIGLRNTKVDSMVLIWPDRTCERLNPVPGSQVVTYKSGLPLFDFSHLAQREKNPTPAAHDMTDATGLQFLHRENHFVEFDREPLIPHMVSTEGPALAVADINKDGLDDAFVGAARDQKSAVFLQQPSGRFQLMPQPDLERDSIDEDTDACWADINKDGNPDLIVASGGNEFYGQDAHNTPRLYLNDGKGKLTKMDRPFGDLSLTASTVVPYDFNGDGYDDLFIGGRCIPWEYGQIPRSYLLLNNKNGTFTDVTETYAKGLGQAGFVTQALWFDIDKDGDKDLLLSLEWGSLTAFVNNKGHFSKKELGKEKGWWNFLLPYDYDNDGDIDLIAGNLGMNSRLKASAAAPVRLYYNDFDGNGKKEQLLTYYVNGKEIPFASKAELEKQIPLLKKKFLYAGNFAKAQLSDLFDKEKFDQAQVLTADYFCSALLVNDGHMNFKTVALPYEAQLTAMRAAAVTDANADGLPDVLLMGNYYDNNIEMGRYDADYGTVLINKGKGSFHPDVLNGVAVKGQVRQVRPITIRGQQAYILARNNDSLKVIGFRP
jgi:hypothetical protein